MIHKWSDGKHLTVKDLVKEMTAWHVKDYLDPQAMQYLSGLVRLSPENISAFHEASSQRTVQQVLFATKFKVCMKYENKDITNRKLAMNRAKREYVSILCY